MTVGTIASARIAAPLIRGAAIRNPGRRPACRISGPVSPAGARAGGHLDSIGPMSHHWAVGALQSRLGVRRDEHSTWWAFGAVGVRRGGGGAWAVPERAALTRAAQTRAAVTWTALTR